MMKIASNPLDVQDLQFKLQCRIKIFDNVGENFAGTSSNLIAAASRFGLIFVCCNSPKLKVIRFASLEEYSSSPSDVITNYSRREVNIPSVSYHISVNCDHTKLAVLFEADTCPVVSFYDVQSFLKENIVILNEVRLSTTPGVKILEASWHPTIADIFTECKEDGTLGIYELKGKSVDISGLPAESKATCFCWSPKGKQIAVGSNDGKITHYKPDLKAVKCINAPPFEKPHSIISLQWISNYQFVGVFKPLDNSEEQCSVVTIDAPKTGNPTFTNFYDVCFSNGNFRWPQFYLIFECHWNILIVASANSMETGVLSCMNDTWNQWTLPDSSRAELPLDENREETYPLGVAFDTSSVKPIPWGESSLQPAPSLLLLSHKGVLCCFKMINLKEGAVSVTSPPDNIADLSGLGCFTTGSAEISKQNIHPKGTLPVENKSLPQKAQEQVPSQDPRVPKVDTPPQSSVTVPPVTQISHKPLTFAPQFKPQQLPAESVQITSQPDSITSATNLFGGQITITPTNRGANQNTSTSLIGSMLLSNLSSAATNLPLTSSTNILVTPKPIQQPSNHAQLPITTTPKIVQPVTSIKISMKPPIQADEKVAPLAERPPGAPIENNEEIEKILDQMIQMECSALEDELKLLIFQGKQTKINLNNEDMSTIVNQTKDMEDFIEELVETSESQSSEVYVLKQNTIQSWAWLEEARSRYVESQNEEINAVLKSRPLDSVSEKHLCTLQQMEYYLESQLSQAHKALDEQWDKFQEYCRKINRVQLPTMEAIFQTMVKQNAILQKHEYILKDLASQIRGKKSSRNYGSLLNPLTKVKSLEDSFQSMKLEPEDIYRIYYQKVLNRIRSMTPSKSNHLRRVLHNRNVTHVTVKSLIARSALPKTPQMRTKSIIVHMTPTSKQTEVVRNLNFYQSTPLNSSLSQITGPSLSAFAPTNTIPPSNFSKLDIDKQRTAFSSSASVPNLVAENIVKYPPSTEVDGKTTTSSTSLFGTTMMSNMNQISEKTKTITGQSQNSISFQNLTLPGKDAPIATPASQTQLGQSSLILTNKPISTTEKVETTATSISKGNSVFSIEQIMASTNATTNSSFFGKPNSIQSSNSSMTVFSGPGLTVRKSLGSDVVSVTNSFNVPNRQLDSSKSIQPSSLKTSLATSVVTSGVSAASKPSFFTPISSTQLTSIANVSQQSSLFTSTKPSAFTPITTSQIPMSVAKSFLSGSGTTSTSLFAKPAPLISAVGTSATSTTVSHATAVVTSTSAKPLMLVSSTGQQTGSIFGSSATSTSGFSFVSGITVSKPATTQSNIISSSSTAFSPIGGNNQVPVKPIVSNQTVSSIAATTNDTTSTTTSTLFASSSTAPSSSDTGSIFGVSTVTSNLEGAGLTFGTVSSSSSGTSVFGKTATSTASLGSITANSGSLFSAESDPTKPIVETSNAPAFATTTSSLFGASSFGTATTTITNTTTTSSSIFGNSASAFGGNSVFGQSTATTSATPIFGGSATFAAPVTISSAQFTSSFGNTTASGSVFGSVTTSSTASFGTSTSTSHFGNVATSASSPFASGTATSGSSLFGSVAATSASPFISVASTSASVPFQSVTSTSVSSPFGSVTSSSASSPFGGVTSSTASSPFGNIAATSASSPFGSVAATSTSSPFASVTATSVSSPFGVTGSVFGGNATNPPTLFGATPTSSGSPFGAVSTATGSLFGASGSSGTTSPFGQTSIFGKSTFGNNFNSTQPTTSSVFGQNTSGSSSVFGKPSVFGAATTSSTFGTASTPFGSASSAASTPPFGQTNPSGGIFGSSQSVFGSTGTTQNTGSSFGFGSLNVSGSAQSPFAKTETKSPFGSATFNTTATTGSLFGSSSFGNTAGGSVFGQSSFGGNSTFGNTSQQPGPFSDGSGTVAQSGFGAAQAFPKPTGFGAQPTFGGSSAFGAAPTFGGAPTFGAGSAFGSPNKVFGSSSPTGVFGSSTNQQSPGFGNFATQNTIGFGNLAQQSANNAGQGAPFSGNSSFSSWR